VTAALTILNAHHNDSRPDQLPRLQSFERWSDTVRAALSWLRQGDPVRTMERLRKNDTAISNMI
jgi:putative DNA primase/helicase